MAWDGGKSRTSLCLASPERNFWAKSAARPDISDVSQFEVCAISLQQGTQSILALGGEIIPQL